MSKVRVPIFNTVGKSVLIERGSPGATIGTDVRLPNGTVPSLNELARALGVGKNQSSNELSNTLWRLIREKPANITAIAAVTGEGIVSRTAGGAFNTGIAVLDDLADVSTYGATDGQALVFYQGDWMPGDVAVDENPVPTLTSISPTEATPGDPKTTLTLTGTNFIEWSVALWDGRTLATTFISSTELEAVIPSSLLYSADTVDVTVKSPLPGGGTTAAQTFSISSDTDYPSVVEADSPVGYYRCGEASGSTLVSEVNSPANDGDIKGTVTYGETGAISGDPDTAIETDGANANYLEVPIVLNTTSNDGFAIEFWLIWDSGRVIFRDSLDTLLFDTSGTIFARIRGETDFNTGLTTADYRDGSYHHFVFEYDHANTDFNLYIDGVLEYTEDRTLASGDTDTWFRFMRNGDDGSINAAGTIDEIALYDAPLGLTRVQAHYDEGIGV